MVVVEDRILREEVETEKPGIPETLCATELHPGIT